MSARTHTFSILPVSPGTYEEIRGKLKSAGYDHALIEDGIDMHGIALKLDDGRYTPTVTVRRKHPLTFVSKNGLLAEALGLPWEECRQIEETVAKCVAEGKSLFELLKIVGELEITDELWANFLYTFGWWDGRRRS